MGVIWDGEFSGNNSGLWRHLGHDEVFFGRAADHGGGPGWHYRAAADGPARPGYLEERFRPARQKRRRQLTREEAKNAAWFDKLDLNGDGIVTLGRGSHCGAPDCQRECKGGKDLTAIPGADATGQSPPRDPRWSRRLERVWGVDADLAFTDIEGKAGKLFGLQILAAVVIAFTRHELPGGQEIRAEPRPAGKGIWGKSFFLFVNPTARRTRPGHQGGVEGKRAYGSPRHDLDAS